MMGPQHLLFVMFIMIVLTGIYGFWRIERKAAEIEKNMPGRKIGNKHWRLIESGGGVDLKILGGRAPGVSLFGYANINGSCNIRRTMWVDRWFKAVGSDNLVCIECGDSMFQEAILSNPRIMTLLDEVLNIFPEISVSPQGCIFSKLSGHIAFFNVSDISRAAKLMGELQDYLKTIPSAGNDYYSRSKRLTERLNYFNIALSVVFVLVFLLFAWLRSVNVGMLLYPWRAFIVITLVEIPILLWLGILAIQSWRPYVSTPLILRWFYNFVLTIILAGWVSVSISNKCWDQSLSQEHKVWVLSKAKGHGKGGDYYNIHISSWNDQGTVHKLTVTLKEYTQIREGQSFLITTRRGFWGLEWIERYSIDEVHKKEQSG